MSAYSVNPNAAQVWDKMFRCAITRWDDGKSTIVAWTEGKTPEDAVNIGAAIVLALNNAVADEPKKKPKKGLLSGLTDQDLIALVVGILDPMCMRVYKDGDCMPRGHEGDTAENVNKIQGFRKRTATNKASAVLKTLGLIK